MSKQVNESNLTNAEIRNHIEYSLKILVSIFDEKLQKLESNISNLNTKIEMLTQRVDFLERTTNTPVTSKTEPVPIKQDASAPKRPAKDKTSTLSDALKLIEDLK